MTTWEIPDEPDVARVWIFDQNTGLPIMVSADMSEPLNRGSARWLVDDAYGGRWYMWGELLQRGPVTDENPTPQPPKVMWSPSEKRLYVETGVDDIQWTVGPQLLKMAKDAVPMTVKEPE